MASGINKVILIGNLGDDPTMTQTKNGEPVANITLATGESWKDKNTGEKKELTEWHQIVFFRGLAGIVGEYLKKGSKIYVEGKLVTMKWQNAEGQDRWTTKIHGREMRMLGGGESKASGDAHQKPKDISDNNQSTESRSPNVQMDFDDDIPF